MNPKEGFWLKTILKLVLKLTRAHNYVATVMSQFGSNVVEK